MRSIVTDDTASERLRALAEHLLALTGGVPLEDGVLIWIRVEEPVLLLNLCRTREDWRRISLWIHQSPDLLALIRDAIKLSPEGRKRKGGKR
jgi:hypothetical protein